MRRILAFLLSVPLLACGPKLGDIPFLCNPGMPRCPDGYDCRANVCVRSGTCPEFLPECKVPASCGNGTCDAGETNANCPADCGQASCGNGKCDPEESNTTCPTDCAPSSCGNGKCEAGETSANCPADCSSSSCGNGKCDPGETPVTCPADCPNMCGNGKCDNGETNATCPADCPTSTCGNGKCDAGETSATCPADCPATCTGTATQCDGTDKLKHCESGVFKTDTCASICTSASYNYSSGCEYSSAKGQDVCVCGKYVTFGGMCDDKLKCDPALFCGVFGTGAKGFCTKYCTNSGGVCSGAPMYTYATCSLQVSGKYACGFECDYDDCPTSLKCDYASGLCKP